MMYITIKQANEREQLLFGKKYNINNYRLGGVCGFDKVPAETMRKLIDEKYADPEETQNESPSIQEFLDFIEAREDPDNWYLHGYAVSPERDDVRVSVEGIGSYAPVSAEDLVDFVKLCRYADELDCTTDNPAYCWYD